MAFVPIYTLVYASGENHSKTRKKELQLWTGLYSSYVEKVLNWLVI